MITKLILTALLLLTIQVYSDTAIVTYHLYTKYDKLTTVSCSDGANGLMSWGYKDISMMFPYVTAWQPASWNSPQCGSCVKIMWNGKYTYVTVIDQCGIINSAYSHFDMSKEAFIGLFGQEGYAKGTMTANFTIVASKYCPGNRKGFIGLVGMNQNIWTEMEHRDKKRGENQSAYGGGQNPLWVKKESDIRPNLGTESLSGQKTDYSRQSNIQQKTEYNTKGNPLWIKSPPSSESKPKSPSFISLSDKTEYGGFSFDKRNERMERENL